MVEGCSQASGKETIFYNLAYQSCHMLPVEGLYVSMLPG